MKLQDYDIGISCVSHTGRGFCTGMYGIGMISLYEIDRNDKVSHKGNFKIKEEAKLDISCMHTSADDMYIVLTVKYRQKSNFYTTNTNNAFNSGNSPDNSHSNLKQIESH